MDKNEILAILNDWNFWHQDLETGIRREEYWEKFERALRTDQIIVITGPRRSGKSYLMRQFIKRLTAQGIEKKEILMINFEDPRFVKLDTRALQRIYEVYLESLSPLKKPYIFLDEVQEVEEWEKWVRSIHELKKAKIILSGSNAKLLGQELATLLTGRHYDLVVSPLNFKEFLEFNGLDIKLDIKNELKLISQRIRIKSLLRSYLEFGSFPQIALKEPKKELLLSYFEDILDRDLIKRYRIRKREKIKSLAKFYLGNFSSQITFNSLKKTLELSTDTVEKFSGYLENAYLAFFLKRFSFKVKEQEKSPRKVYVVDTGLANIIGLRFSRNWGRLAENLVFLNLYRQKIANPSFDFYFWKDARGREVDFLVKENLKIVQAIQVCWQFNHPQTREREIKSLLKVMKQVKVEKGLIITEEEEKEEKIRNKVIKIVPLWRWLLV